jgi:hypothetical protein
MTDIENRSLLPMTRQRAADLLNCSERTVDRLIEGGYLTRYEVKSSEGERGPVLLWEWEVQEMRDAQIRLGIRRTRSRPQR